MEALTKIIQLGNGEGLDFDQTNSSFLIELYDKNSSENIYILFDCGFNVPKKLIEEYSELIPKIKYLFISHAHEDHIGGLSSFLHYRRKILKIKEPIFVLSDTIYTNTTFIYDYLKLQNTQFELIAGKAKSFSIKDLLEEKNNFDIENVGFSVIKTDHRIIESYGLLIYDNKKAVFITGDTKANREMKKDVLNICEELEVPLKFVFHDYSNWNNVNSNPHACDLDLEWEYGDELFGKDVKFIKYHDGRKDFIKEYDLRIKND